MSISHFIQNATIKELLNIKDIYKYISSYQAAFNKVVNLFIKASQYTCQSIERNFQATN